MSEPNGPRPGRRGYLNGKKLSPKDAARYLTEHGKPITVTALGNLRGLPDGGGLPFYKESDD